jgi:hypothetical protein
MVLRTIALVLFGLALCMAVFLGWNYPLGTLLYGVNRGGMGATQLGIERLLGPSVWNAAFEPLMRLPAWSLPTFIGAVLMLIAALRPGKG